MQVALRGSSASTVTAGILLLTHAKRLGHPIKVVIEGSPEDAASVPGPALVNSPMLSGCGVGRVRGRNGLVCMPGPAISPLLLSLEPGGLSDWFQVDRAGVGIHPSSTAVVGLCRHADPQGRNLGNVLRRALDAVGCPAEPALLDILFGAPVDPIVRVALALVAGREMTGRNGESFTRFVQSGITDIPDPLPTPLSVSQWVEARESGAIEKLTERLQPGLSGEVMDWLNGLDQLPNEPSMAGLVCSIAEVGSHLLSLPMAGMLPALSPSAERVARHLGPAIGVSGPEHCGLHALIQTYVFLGGGFVDYARFAVTIDGDAPPDGREARWQWLCQSAYLAKVGAGDLWRKLVDPLQ